jgi:molybdenum cofactor biosynthesis protein B
MVDFQERDTRRGFDEPSEEDKPEAEPEDEPEADHDEPADHDHEEHDHEAGHHAHDLEHLGVGILTVSSSRTLESDPSGDAIEVAVEADGHEVVTRELVGDSHDRVQQSIAGLAGRRDVDIVVSTGGTGVTPDDVTIEAVRPLIDKQLPGFGELFRALSFEDIGPRVVATRATAGIVDGVPVFCMPGSEAAVRLGIEDIILPVAGHLAGLAYEEDEEEE